MSHTGDHPCLPPELILAVIDQTEEDEDLLILASGSRYFHEVSMNAYFSRSAFDPHAVEIILTPFKNSLNVLPGLAVYLGSVGASVHHLSYDFGDFNGRENHIKEVRLLTRYVEKLSMINNASLRLATHLEGDPDKWRTGNIILLKTIMEKSCRSIEVVTTHLSSCYEEPKSLPMHKISDCLHGYWPAGHESSTSSSRHLKEIVIQTFPLFLRPFYYHTLKSNTWSLTRIEFKNFVRRGGGSDWVKMMRDIHFPRLTHLSVVHGIIPRSQFVKFLQNHRILQDFHYHHIQYEETKPRYLGARVNRDAFERLQTLTTAQEHIVNFFPSMDRLVALTDVTIQVEERHANFNGLENALRCLTLCTNKITLSLEVSSTGLGFGDWLSNGVHSGLKSRPESLLHCVETLSLDNGVRCLTKDFIDDILPVWLRLFPALRALTLRGRMYQSNEPIAEVDTDLDTLKDACPGVYIEWHGR